ncbi:MAG: hypothetical protein A3F72_18070 [Bacteroidetes bacterium RIFCSPLOWO2_12_FULL_35_15]|nr:MAG: hypothetical protein A3F72_18070 [Bacteroidetes bacterium RIFCSPLOWO2_12_FULL_35_15]
MTKINFYDDIFHSHKKIAFRKKAEKIVAVADHKNFSCVRNAFLIRPRYALLYEGELAETRHLA